MPPFTATVESCPALTATVPEAVAFALSVRAVALVIAEMKVPAAMPVPETAWPMKRFAVEVSPVSVFAAFVVVPFPIAATAGDHGAFEDDWKIPFSICSAISELFEVFRYVPAPVLIVVKTPVPLLRKIAAASPSAGTGTSGALVSVTPGATSSVIEVVVFVLGRMTRFVVNEATARNAPPPTAVTFPAPMPAVAPATICPFTDGSPR